MGFGLTISKMLIEEMQGNVDVKSKVGQGTVFTIDLPINNIENPVLNLRDFK